MEGDCMQLSAARVAAAAASLAILAANYVSAGPPPALPSEPDVAQLQSALMTHRTTVTAVVQHYLRRIQILDAQGPALHSIIQVNPDAVSLAGKMDAATTHDGILFGVPVVLKDNIETSDGLLTTAGSLALVNSKPQRDAFIVRKLRASGAVILAKTNLSEWANFRSSRSTSGWSARGGLTRNPYDTKRNACGSSSGSGAAIAADLAVVAVGTETDGSIVCPSSANGLVGIKPTVGLVSRSGIIPISHSQDTAGPMCRTVRDAAILLGAIVGVDPDDPSTAASRGKTYNDYTRFLDSNGLRGARVGAVRKYFGFHQAVDARMHDAI